MAKDNTKYWVQNKFNGGFSDDKFIGIPDSFQFAKGIEIRKNAKSIKLANGLTKISGTECNHSVEKMITIKSSGDVLFFLANGRVLRRTNGAGSLSLVYTMVDNDSKIIDAIEYNSYVYWFTSKYVHRIAVSHIGDSWSSYVSEKYQTFTNQNTNAHPAIELNNNLYIGDGNYLSELSSAGVFTADKLKIFSDEYIRSITFGGTMMRIFSVKNNNIDSGHKYFWNGATAAYSERIFIKQFVHCAINDGGDDLVLAGSNPYIYLSSGYDLFPLKRFPMTDYTGKAYFSPNSLCFHKGILHIGAASFGISNVDQSQIFSSVDFGVWTYGQENKNYPMSLNLDYPIIDDSGVNTIENIHSSNGILYISYAIYSSTNQYGVYIVDTTKYRTSGYLISRIMPGSRACLDKELSSIKMVYKQLAAGEKIEVFLNKDFSDSYTSEIKADYAYTPDGGVTYPDRSTIKKEVDVALNSGDFNTIESKIVLTAGTSQLTTPELFELEIGFNETIEPTK